MPCIHINMRGNTKVIIINITMTVKINHSQGNGTWMEIYKVLCKVQNGLLLCQQETVCYGWKTNVKISLKLKTAIPRSWNDESILCPHTWLYNVNAMLKIVKCLNQWTCLIHKMQIVTLPTRLLSLGTKQIHCIF